MSFIERWSITSWSSNDGWFSNEKIKRMAFTVSNSEKKENHGSQKRREIATNLYENEKRKFGQIYEDFYSEYQKIFDKI